MSSPPEICCSGSNCVVAESSCRASTSRGLSHSSGDFDDQENAGRCSCCSESYYLLEYYNKPCYIVDSSTKIHTSKWQTFKNYFKKRKISRKLKPLSIVEESEKSSKKKKKKKKNKREAEKSLEDSETVEPETSHTPAPSCINFTGCRKLVMSSRSLCIKMELSPVSGGRSSSSDFSIERILSAEPRGQREESPSWLCCTRYRPPRLPRAPAAGCRPRRSGRHARVPFTAAQAAALEAAYSRAPYLAPPALRALASALQLRDDRIKIWFQNRRARERREKCSTITPPNEVTLPATVALPPTHLWLQDIGDSSRVMNEERNRSMYESVSENRMVDCYIEDNEESNESNEERSETPLDVESID